MRKQSRSQGQALVEFALVFPLLFFLLALSIDLFRVDWVTSTVAEAARQAARQAVANEVPTDNAFGAAFGRAFVVENIPLGTAFPDDINPSGLRVEISGTAVVPEPGTAALLVLSGIGCWGMRPRRRC